VASVGITSRPAVSNVPVGVGVSEGADPIAVTEGETVADVVDVTEGMTEMEAQAGSVSAALATLDSAAAPTTA